MNIRMQITGFWFLALFSWSFNGYGWDLLSVFDTKCQKLDWVKEESRTMGGGWIWFPGKGRDTTSEKAMLRAEGNALRILIQECQHPHRDVKIHERCIDDLGGTYMAHVRLSLRDFQCDDTKSLNPDHKLVNQELVKIYNKFTKLDKTWSENHNQDDVCQKLTEKNCFEKGRYLYFTGDFEHAKKVFHKTCEKGMIDACFNAALLEWEKGDKKVARGLFTLGCKREDAQSCFFLGKILLKEKGGIDQENQGQFEFACQKSVLGACQELGRYFLSTDNFTKAKNYFELACQKGSTDYCHESSVLYFDRDLKDESLEFSKKGCQQNGGKPCFNVGFMTQDKEKKLEYFKKSCELNVKEGCIQVAKLESNNVVKSKFEKLACDLGDGPSCQAVSVWLYDKKSFRESLSFAKLACKLGELKSCHNAGHLEYKEGNSSEAKIFLTKACTDGLSASCDYLKKVNN